MKAAIIKIEKGPICHVPEEYQESLGCDKLQLIEITYNFFGAIREQRFDTKILPNGDQIIINGSGFFPSGTKIN